MKEKALDSSASLSIWFVDDVSGVFPFSSLVETVSRSAAVIPERSGVCMESRRSRPGIEPRIDFVPGDESTRGLRISVGAAVSETV